MSESTEIKLAAAIMSPEDGVSQPARRKSSSFTAVLIDLTPGETATRAVQIDPHLSMVDITRNVAAWRQEFRNSLGASVASAKKKAGGEYSIEVDDHLSGKGRLFILGMITRTA